MVSSFDGTDAKRHLVTLSDDFPHLTTLCIFCCNANYMSFDLPFVPESYSKSVDEDNALLKSIESTVVSQQGSLTIAQPRTW